MEEIAKLLGEQLLLHVSYGIDRYGHRIIRLGKGRREGWLRSEIALGGTKELHGPGEKAARRCHLVNFGQDACNHLLGMVMRVMFGSSTTCGKPNEHEPEFVRGTLFAIEHPTVEPFAVDCVECSTDVGSTIG